MNTVNPEIFNRILFSRIALNNIFATLKIRDNGMIFKTMSVNDRVISPFCEDFIFTKSFKKIEPSRKFPYLQYVLVSLH